MYLMAMPKKKKIGPDHQLAAHIPFYRTRKFWALLVGTLLVWDVIYVLFTIDVSTVTLYSVFLQLSFSFGALPIVILFDGIFGEIFSLVIFYTVVFILIYKAFQKRERVLTYSFILILVLISGHLARVLLSGVI